MDGNVAAMSLQERGAYITLLCICWQEKSLPIELTRLANMVGLPRRPFQKLWPALSGCFVQQGDRLFHPRLEKEREKQARFSRRQSDAAEARWSMPKPSHSDATALPQHIPKPCFPDLRSPISGKEKTERDSEPLDEAWNTFTTAYPQDRVERGRIVQDGFIAACREVGVAGVMARLAAHKRSAQWRKGMVPKLGNYFGDKQLWRQELPEQEAVSGTKTAADITEMARERIQADEARYGKR